MAQISFRTQDQTSRQAQSGFRAKIHSWSMIHCVLDLRQKSTIRALFKAKSVDPKTYSLPHNITAKAKYTLSSTFEFWPVLGLFYIRALIVSRSDFL